jgi:tetratricopeptide (TPR) repeat protein
MVGSRCTGRMRSLYLGIDQVAKSGVSTRKNIDIISLVGWCHYRLGEYEEAARTFVEALALDANSVYTHFDLALALMCDGRYSRALRKYGLTIELAKSKHILRRRGLLWVARRELKEAIDEQPRLAEVVEAQEGLEWLDNAWSDVEGAAPATL